MRFDPQFHEFERLKRAYYASPSFPLVPLENLTIFIQYGISERASTSAVGVPMIRMINLQMNGWELSDLKYIELEEAALERYRLERGDLLFNRTNSKELVGKCEVFRESGDWVFASYLMRVRVDEEKVLPDFVTSFLNTSAGRIQIDQVSRQIAGMSNVNAEELKGIVIPYPPLVVQRRLVAELDAVRAERDNALEEAERLISSFEAWATMTLGLSTPKNDERKAYAIRRNAAISRIDPFFHSPEFLDIEQVIRTVPHAMLGSLVVFSSETWTQREHSEPTFRYIEISGVDRRRGKAKSVELPVDNAPSRARMTVQPNDIIVSLTRPHLGSIALLEDCHEGCIASTGFAVIRDVDVNRVNRKYLWSVLRLSISLKQMLRRASGGNYPAITQAELANVLIPVPENAVQQRIVAEALQRNIKADRLEANAETIWREARERFERQLLKGDNP